MDPLRLLSLSFDHLCLLCVLHLHDERGVFLEVNTIESHEGWNPNGKPCSELSIGQVILEDRVAGIFHQIDMFEIWASCSDFMQSLILI
jgi:hypothetical protein